MNKASFALAFQDAIEIACRFAEESLGKPLSRDVTVRMYGASIGGLEVSPSEFIDRAYINDETFYRLIDIMVTEVVGTKPLVFARISDHKPGPLSSCWNGKQGPFKQLTANAITQR